jgi:hypothetical protein
MNGWMNGWKTEKGQIEGGVLYGNVLWYRKAEAAPPVLRAGNVVYGCHTRRLVQSSLFPGLSLPAYPVVK